MRHVLPKSLKINYFSVELRTEQSFHTDVNDGQQGLEQFRGYWLPALRETGYRLSSNKVWLTSYRFTGYESGYEMKDGLTICSKEQGERTALELKVGQERKPERDMKVLGWFRQLRTIK